MHAMFPAESRDSVTFSYSAMLDSFCRVFDYSAERLILKLGDWEILEHLPHIPKQRSCSRALMDDFRAEVQGVLLTVFDPKTFLLGSGQAFTCFLAWFLEKLITLKIIMGHMHTEPVLA